MIGRIGNGIDIDKKYQFLPLLNTQVNQAWLPSCIEKTQHNTPTIGEEYYSWHGVFFLTALPNQSRVKQEARNMNHQDLSNTSLPVSYSLIPLIPSHANCVPFNAKTTLCFLFICVCVCMCGHSHFPHVNCTHTGFSCTIIQV